MPSRLWKFLTQDVRDLVSLETIDGTKDAADAVLGLAAVLKEEGPKVDKLVPLIAHLDSLLDVLNSPFGKILESSLPFVSIGTGLLKFYLEKTKEEPTLAQSVALISQSAYLESFKELLEKQSPESQAKIISASQGSRGKSITPEVKSLGAFELSDKEARLATLHFHQSSLAKKFNEALIARLIQLGFKEESASKFADLVSRGANRYVRNAISDSGDSVKRITEWYRTGGDAVFEKYLSIDSYLDEWIASRPHECVFAEKFSFKDIYVPLKAQPLNLKGEPDKDREPVVLEDWVRRTLDDENQKDKVIFIQGEPGRGKSVFCRIFSDWVRRHEHPHWTPILIRLRDVSVLSKDFEETLGKAVDRDFAKTDSGWLTDRNVNFLFFLDGFDELLMEGRTSGGLDSFLEQVGRFQEQCARNSEKGHRILITGRTLALQAIERRIPSNLARVNILPMDSERQRKWFERWDSLLHPDEANFEEILQDDKRREKWKDRWGALDEKTFQERLNNQDELLKSVRNLAQEPLLLYLLAAMYRDKELRLEMFEGTEDANAKVLIYERTLDWVLTKQRAENYQKQSEDSLSITARDLNPDITELAPEQLRRVLQEAGLCVVQSGMEFANIKTVENRLSQDSAAKKFLEDAQNRLKTGDTPLRNALAAFYLQEGRQGIGSIEFVHKSFGEFLCAERMVRSLVDWSHPGRNRPFDIQDPEFHLGIYDLFGGEILSPEIVEYVVTILLSNSEFDIDILFDRFLTFYNHWRGGFFVDGEPPTLPQHKMKELAEVSHLDGRKRGQRQVDVIVGLNILILLIEIAKCFDKETQLIQLSLQSDIHEVIGYSRCLGPGGFAIALRPFLLNSATGSDYVEIQAEKDVETLSGDDSVCFLVKCAIANVRMLDVQLIQNRESQKYDDGWISNISLYHDNDVLDLNIRNPQEYFEYQRLLILSAYPKQSMRLRLDEEVREISEGMRRARLRENFDISQRWIVRPRDLLKALIEEAPQIVHFSSHEVEAGLFFEDETGEVLALTEAALESLFKLVSQKTSIRCVVLNRCYSQKQANIINKYVPYVVGIPKSLSFQSAVEFAVGFYDAISNEKSIEFAFEGGRIAMELGGSEVSASPVLLVNE